MLILSVMHENMMISLDPVEVVDALSIVMYLLWCTCTLYGGVLALLCHIAHAPLAIFCAGIYQMCFEIQ